MAFLLRAALTGVALWIVTWFVPGMTFVGGDTTLQRIGIVFVVAVIFGLVNAVIKPIVQIMSIPLYVLTLGLIHIVINALMLWLTSWVSGLFDLGWSVSGFWAALLGSIIVSIISFVLNAFIPDRDEARRPVRA